MTDQEIVTTVVGLGRNLLGPAFSAGATMDTVPEWDSLTHIQLLSAVERAFGLRIQSEDALRLVSVDSIVRHVREKTP